MLEGDPVNGAAEHSAEHAGGIHCRGQNISAWYPGLLVETSFASTTAGICSSGLRPPLSRGMQGTRLRCALVSQNLQGKHCEGQVYHHHLFNVL